MYANPTATWNLGGTLAMMWGRPIDWRFESLLQIEGDQYKASGIINTLGALAVEYGLKRILSPTVSDFSSLFLNDSQQSPRKLSLPGTACNLHRGLRGDGIEIHPGDAGIIASADCPVIVVTTPSGRVLMLHAGRDSLVDRKKIETGQPSKQYESIVFAAWHELYRVSTEDALESRWFVLPSISSGEHFRHDWDIPQGGESNRRLVTYIVMKYGNSVMGHPKFGMIDVTALIASQLTEYCGLHKDHITSTGQCTYNNKDGVGDYMWHSHRRAVQLAGDPKARNLVVVINSGS